MKPESDAMRGIINICAKVWEGKIWTCWSHKVKENKVGRSHLWITWISKTKQLARLIQIQLTWCVLTSPTERPKWILDMKLPSLYVKHIAFCHHVEQFFKHRHALVMAHCEHVIRNLRSQFTHTLIRHYNKTNFTVNNCHLSVCLTMGVGS